MAEVRAFRGLRFVGDLGPRLAPPYDVIDPAARDALGRYPENLVHLTLPERGKSGPDYARAGERLIDWVASGVLVRDAEPAVYVVEERLAEGRVRRGMLAAVRLADYAEREVLPHERTMAGPKEDRLRLTRAVRANLEPLFFLYEDREQVLPAAMEKALAVARLARAKGPHGGEVTLAALRDAREVEAVQDFLAKQPLLIADGHHRYETMLLYRDEQRASGADDRSAPHEFVMAYLGNVFDPGSRIEAAHRVLRGPLADVRAALAEAGFAMEPLLDAAGPSVLGALARRAPAAHAFAIAHPGGGADLAVRARGDKLDVEVLHEELLPRLGGELSFDARTERVLETLRRRDASLGILMHPLDPDTFFRTVRAGRVLPEKSTFFSPKIPGGLVIRTLQD